ncbi:Signal peptidase subunit 3 [Mycena sanguinolenta]|uniref:Signal peptidase subunit 3 n=1 Tax=Mycena sanguinolenta TaxID=230812 RepID=A0A8H6Y3M4_9AGAR|nr:Signal peptidase subunit 3 [Mycena sanguinolenta]
MHTLFSRINNLSALLSSCVMGLLAAIAISSMLQTFVAPPLPQGSVQVNSVKNTKQLFLYLEGEYTNYKGVKNAVVIWDKIVRRKEDATIKVTGKKVGGRQKYAFKDVHGFRNASATYTLRYNLMPHVGALVYGVAATSNATVPFPPMGATS